MNGVNVYQKRVRFLELWYSSFWGECENVFVSINNSCILLGRNIQDFCNCCLEIQLHGRSVSMHCYWGGRLCSVEAIASAKRDRRQHFVKCSLKLSKPANHIPALLTWLPLGSGPGEHEKEITRPQEEGSAPYSQSLLLAGCSLCLWAAPSSASSLWTPVPSWRIKFTSHFFQRLQSQRNHAPPWYQLKSALLCLWRCEFLLHTVPPQSF